MVLGQSVSVILFDESFISRDKSEPRSMFYVSKGYMDLSTLCFKRGFGLPFVRQGSMLAVH